MDSIQAPDRNQAIAQMMEAHGDTLLRLCFLYLGDRQLAEDALQDTFMNAWRGYHGFRGDSSEKSWLTRIAINCCKGIRRTNWFRRVDIGVAMDALPAGDAPFDAADDTVLRAVHTLKDNYREVILLYYYQNLKTREIASLLNIPEATVSTRLKRAKDKLKPKLERWYFDD